MKKFFLLLASMSIVGCGDTCNLSIKEYTTLTNLTGRDIKIELCKVPYQLESGTTQEKVTTRSTVGEYIIASNQDGDFLADQYSSDYNKDKNKSCEKGDGLGYSSQVFLTPISISQFKLCRDAGDPTKTIIIQKTALCPVGTVSQVQPVVNCDETALIP